tara:strand:+ start:746 stop:946 length:201 start_codon:yes stop_codon:yes gene_type:complete
MKASLILTIIYTIGHFFIAITCVTFITGASLEIAAVDALIEPGINAIWFYVLHRGYEHYFSSSNMT